MDAVKSKRGRPKSEAIRASGEAIRRLLAGEDATVALIAAASGLSPRQVQRRHRDARRREVGGLTGHQRDYLKRSYGRSADPATLEWLRANGINPTGRRRASPDRGCPAA